MNRNILLISGLALVAVACGRNKAPEMAEMDMTPIVSVTTAARQTVPQDAVYSSTVQANVVNNIAPQTVSRIQKINVEVGDFVNAGQVLAEMDRLQMEQTGLQLKNNETELGRLRQLLAEGGISQSDFDAIELSYNVSKSTYDNIVENTILRSPVSGVVSARNYDRGDLYSMGQPIFTVQQIVPVKLLVGISETDYTKVKKGDKVTVTADAFPGKTFTGSVVRLYPVMDPATHTFNVEVQIRNENRELRPGMYARVTVNFGDNNSIVLPDAAVVKQQGSGQRFVYILEGDKVQLKEITLGRHFDDKYEILSGVEEGQKVVVKGQTALKSGITVEVQ